MKIKKINLILASIILIGILVSGFGIVSADRELSYAQGIEIPASIVAGSEVQANFSYKYIEGIADNIDNSPLIIQLNISSNDEENYPVWKGDFEMDGYIERSRLFGLLTDTIPFECSEASNQEITHPIGSETVTAENGTFYCYNHATDLKLDRKDNVFLNIKSHPALWPGSYNLSAKMFYLNDTYAPIVQILNKGDFENVYYKSGNNIEVQANITEFNLDEDNVIGKILWNGDQTLLSKNKESGYYYFSETIPEEIPEGNHTILIFAKDLFGNEATDETRLLIDETPPIIQLLQPVGEGVYSEILPIELDVMDEKSGVDSGSVEFRLREIVNGSICPETGTSLGNYSCVNTGWINIDFNETTKTFKEEVNTTELNLSSGEYWFDARAKDILGNEAYFEE